MTLLAYTPLAHIDGEDMLVVGTITVGDCVIRLDTPLVVRQGSTLTIKASPQHRHFVAVTVSVSPDATKEAQP